MAFLRSQQYPTFEIILVDDHSSDETWQILQSFSNANIRVYTNPDHSSGKKAAQELGISKARNEVILVTDADCTGNSDNWISLMVSSLKGNDISLGYAPLQSSKSLASKFAVFEAWIAGVQYLSYANNGIPYMGVGRNMIFYKKLFINAGGHKANIDLASGDDDLFVNAVSKSAKISVQLQPESFMYSKAPDSWIAFFNQKKRHLTTATRYRFIHQLLLSAFSLSHILLHLGVLVAIITQPKYLNEVIVVYTISLIIKYVISIFIMKKWKQNELIPWFLVMEIMLFLYYIIMSPFAFFNKKSSWN